jgi:RES domain-containing protein
LTTVYRLLRRPFSATPFDGEGSYRYGGRWSTPGTRVVYAAEHLSLAMIEYLVHVDPVRPPRDLVLARASVPDELQRVRLLAEDLPEDWRSYPPPSALSTIGDRFAREMTAAILIVPSALAPTENNWILNPGHPEFHRIRIEATETFDYDPRLLRSTGGPKR